MRNKALSLRILIAALPLVLQGLPVVAQGPGGAEVSGPVDIQANEQDFAGDQVIARGNVHVTYKDSIINAPEAVLTRNEGGSPQMAVFTGHPHMTQAGSIIDADKLTFDIAAEKILAEGHAHSEVISTADEDTDIKSTGAGSKTGNPDKAAPQPKAAGGKGEKIITDADRQEYDRATDRFEAVGHVKVRHGEIDVLADKLSLVYGANKKPETAIFTGAVTATQGKNKTQADNMTYNLTTRRLQATGHVRSKVIQEKTSEGPLLGPPTHTAKAPNLGPDAAMAATTHSGAPAKEDEIIITSDAQDYSKQTGRTAANGNVRVYYDDTCGAGPEAILVRNDAGKAERVIFTGRSQITQPGKRWIADHITLLVATKKVLAEGNTKAFIIQAKDASGKPIMNVPQSKPSNDNSMLAGKSKPGSSISTRKVEATE